MASLNAAGAVLETAEYLPFGSPRASEEITSTDYTFTDQEKDRSTGLFNYDARHYDPRTGRFVSPDSILPNAYDPQQLNRYAYASNNPLRYTDPSGHRRATKAEFRAAQSVEGVAYKDVPNEIKSLLEENDWSYTDDYGWVHKDHPQPWGFCRIEDSYGYLIDIKLVENTAAIKAVIDMVKTVRSWFGLDDNENAANSYEDITEGRSVKNRSTDTTRSDFESNLTREGYSKRMSPDGKVTIYEKDGSSYMIRENASSTGGTTADFYKQGSKRPVLKIRFKGD